MKKLLLMVMLGLTPISHFQTTKPACKSCSMVKLWPYIGLMCGILTNSFSDGSVTKKLLYHSVFGTVCVALCGMHYLTTKNTASSQNKKDTDEPYVWLWAGIPTLFSYGFGAVIVDRLKSLFRITQKIDKITENESPIKP